MSVRRSFAIARRIARQFRRDPRSLALIVVVPVVMLTVLAWIFETEPRPFHIAVAAPNNTGIAAELAASLEHSGRIDAQVVDESFGRARIAAGEFDALVLVPATFVPDPTRTQTLTIVLEGSDPQRSASTLSALSRALPTVLFQLAGLPGQPLAIEAAYVHGGPEYGRLDAFAPVYIAFFAFFFVYLLTSVSFLRERLQGSFERLIVSPLRRSEIVVGYMLGFGFFAALQSIVVVAYVIFALRIDHQGSLVWVCLITLLLAMCAVNLGIALSAFARTELQVVQFIPLVLLPQALLSGVIFPVADLPAPLQIIARGLPLTYANDALRAVMLRGEGIGAIGTEIMVLCGFAVIVIALGAQTLRHDHA